MVESLDRFKGRAQAVWERRERFSWTSRKICFFAQFLIALCYLYFTTHIPLPGFAIAFLGVAAAVMAFRAEAGAVEKVVWIMLVFCLLVLELIAIKEEHHRQDETSSKILNQGAQLIGDLAILKNKQQAGPIAGPAPKPTIKKLAPTTYLSWDLGAPGLGTEEPYLNKLFVNVTCSNAGKEEAKDVDCGSHLYIHDGTHDTFTPQKQETYFGVFVAYTAPTYWHHNRPWRVKMGFKL